MAVPLSNPLVRNMLISAGLLALFAFAGTLLVGTTFELTEETIKANERAALLRSLNNILPSEQHDNDLLRDTLQVQHTELLGRADKVTVFRARQGDKPTALAFEVIAPDGYSGKIKILVGIYQNGRIAGVRVIAHKETPGLGDKVEEQRSDWIHSFAGKSLGLPEDKGWKVKKDGGVFDQFTGATITPRAVVGAVHKALHFYQQQQSILFMSQPEYEQGLMALEAAKKAKADTPQDEG